jgi:hypothetical protein
VTNLEALEALLRRVSRTSRAWRKRHYLYEALEYFEKYGDRHSQIWVLLLWWVCDPDVEGYGLPAPPRHPMCTDCADGNGTCHRDGTSCDPRGVRDADEGEVVIIKNSAGKIVAVTRQDAEGRVLEVLAESTDGVPDYTNHDALAFLVTAVEQYLEAPIGNTSDAMVRLCNAKDRAKKALADGVPRNEDQTGGK